MKKYILVLFLTAVHIVCSAQSAVKDLTRYMSTLRQDPAARIPESVFADRKNEEKLLDVLRPYFKDSLARIRNRAYTVAAKLGQHSRDKTLRLDVVHQLVLAIRDTDSGVSGTASGSLNNFSRTDFSEHAKDSIESYLATSTPHLPRVIKLAGYLNLHHSQPRMYAILNSTGTFQHKWAARLALARMGDGAALTYFRNKLPKAPIDDDFVYDVVPDLIYTRQKEIFVFLENIIHSTDKNCESPDPDSRRKIECGYRVMEALAPVIEGFPFKIDATGTLNTDNYETALAKVREWLRENPDYKIKSETF